MDDGVSVTAKRFDSWFVYQGKKPKAVFNLQEYTDIELLDDSGKRENAFKPLQPKPACWVKDVSPFDMFCK